MKENLIEPFFQAILFAIIADLKSRKLLLSYSNAGLDVSMYETDLYRVVFLLSGIRTEQHYREIREWYDEQIERVIEIEITDTQQINTMAGQIIIGLMERRKKH